MSHPVPLDALVGQEVNGICFVMDYVEIHFNGPILRALAPPILDADHMRWCFPQPGARDALCKLIGRTIRAITVENGVALSCEFESGERLTIPLDAQAALEAAHFVPGPNQPISVW